MTEPKNLIAGQNFLLENFDLHILIIPEHTPTGLVLDTSVFLLNENGKVGSDHDFVFFNQPARLDQGLELDCESHKLTLHLQRVGPAVKKIVLAMTISQGIKTGKTFKDFNKMTVLVKDFITGIEIASFALDT
jgi:tellurite resistance protein TerA